MFAAGLGLVVWAGLNNFRFGHPLISGKGTNHPDPFGNPLVGMAGLLVSPGKSIFLYSPLAVLGILGVYRLARREPRLGQAIAAASVAYLMLISSLSFWGGDWCWGPRYIVVILPLLALGLPFIRHDRAGRATVRTLVASGLAIQLLGISVDQHRFFYERSLPDFFWAADRSFYFRHSALLARPGELLSMVRQGLPAEATRFRPGPYPDGLTYAVFGPGQQGAPQPLWMRHYAVFWLPRPWPLWMPAIPEARRPIDLTTAMALMAGMAVAGAIGIRAGLRCE